MADSLCAKYWIRRFQNPTTGLRLKLGGRQRHESNEIHKRFHFSSDTVNYNSILIRARLGVSMSQRTQWSSQKKLLSTRQISTWRCPPDAQRGTAVFSWHRHPYIYTMRTHRVNTFTIQWITFSSVEVSVTRFVHWRFRRTRDFEGSHDPSFFMFCAKIILGYEPHNIQSDIPKNHAFSLKNTICPTTFPFKYYYSDMAAFDFPSSFIN